ncbi:hypothetical protein ACK3TF_002970 [Chlorella vulgaris]
MATHVIALEVDENAHRASSYDCENRRVIDIFNSYGGSPLVFIRYNPDTPTFPNKQREGFIDSYRKEVLFSVLRQAMNTVPEHHLTIHRVFYPNETGDILTSGWVDPCQPEYTENGMAPLVQVPPYGSARYNSKRPRLDGPSDSSQSSSPESHPSNSSSGPSSTSPIVTPMTAAQDESKAAWTAFPALDYALHLKQGDVVAVKRGEHWRYGMYAGDGMVVSSTGRHDADVPAPVSKRTWGTFCSGGRDDMNVRVMKSSWNEN